MIKVLKVLAAIAGAGLFSQILGIATNKILAAILGPAGLGIYGLYRQLVDSASGMASIGSSGAFVQALSSTEGRGRLQSLSAAMWLNVFAIVATSLVMIFFSPVIAQHYFVHQGPAVEWAIGWLSVPIALTQVALIAYNCLSVSRSFKLLSLIIVAPALASLVFCYPLARMAAQDDQWGYVGMLIAPPMLQFLLALRGVASLGWLREIGNSFRIRPRIADLLHYLRWHGTMLPVALANAAVFLILPPLLIQHYGVEANGYFRASWALSAQNLAILLSSLGTYFTPVLSGAKTDQERQKVLNDAAFLIVLFSLPMIGGLIVFQPLVLRILYSSEFLPAIEMLRWLLLANYFSIVLWLFTLVSTTRAHMRIFAVTNIGYSGGFLFLGWLAVGFPVGSEPFPWLRGISGLGISEFTSHGIAMVAMVALTWRRYRYLPDNRTVLVWLTGLIVLALCAAMTWNEVSVNWFKSIALALLCCFAPALLLDARRWQQLRSLTASLVGKFGRGGQSR